MREFYCECPINAALIGHLKSWYARCPITLIRRYAPTAISIEARQSPRLGMSWKRRQELLIEFERHEHANLHDANAD